jgi:hypothetical protein
MNTFNAAVEQSDNRDWRGRRVGVGTQPRGRGVVALLDCGVEVKGQDGSK